MLLILRSEILNRSDLDANSYYDPSQFTLDSDVVFATRLVAKVNGTQFTTYQGPDLYRPLATSLLTQFPFKRFSFLSPDNSSMLYIHHQLDRTTLAEEQYDTNRGLWTASNNISIST